MRKKETINLVKSRNRGPLEFETHASEHEGDVMSIAKKKVVTAPQTATIKEAAEIMVKNQFRRLPITDPGSNKLLGIVTSMDILNFLGGGDKYKILEEKHHDNFPAAVNGPVKDIMTRKVIVLSNKGSITDAVTKMIDNGVGVLPIVDSEQHISGIISEKDITMLLAGVLTDELVSDFMSKDVITTTPGTRIEGASKIMVRNQFRRIPVIGEERKTPHPEDEHLVGIVTCTDVLEFLGKNQAFERMTTNSAEEVLNTTITEIMEKEVVTVEPLTRLGDTCQLMDKKGIGGLPVIKDEIMQGIITERDILNAIRG
jgi:CBS domain-containing protein